MDNAIRSDNQCFSVNAADRPAASKEDEGGTAHGDAVRLYLQEIGRAPLFNSQTNQCFFTDYTPPETGFTRRAYAGRNC